MFVTFFTSITQKKDKITLQKNLIAQGFSKATAAYLPIWIQKSPRIVPGKEFA